MFAVLGLITSDFLLARGGHGGGHHIGGGGHRGFGGGHRHFGGRHHFRGGHHGSRGRHHHHFGGHRHHFGLGLYFPGYYYGYRPYYRPYYRYPSYSYLYGQQAAPSTAINYIQREEIKPDQPRSSYWHYCMNPEGYYPYVKQCPEGWLQVAPRPSVQ